MKRFKYHSELGFHYNQDWLCGLTDDELAKEIREADVWDFELMYDLCWRAGLEKDADKAFRDNGNDSAFFDVAFAAADKLGVTII